LSFNKTEEGRRGGHSKANFTESWQKKKKKIERERERSRVKIYVVYVVYTYKRTTKNMLIFNKIIRVYKTCASELHYSRLIIILENGY